MAWAVVELAKLPRSPSRLMGIPAEGKAERMREDLTLVMTARRFRQWSRERAQPTTDEFGIGAISIALGMIAET